ncbi:MAG TPA: D-alanyl-D-alanine carboxypeptidase [Candidatus Binatia bacterium]|nr:D-alanyl-D-alanine carboxypeptidase [Candidatus Binatia bacterium]
MRSGKLNLPKAPAVSPILTFFLVVFSVKAVWSFSPDTDLTARAAVLMDASTGKILYQKEPDLRLPPASTTKVVTAILALESGRKLTDSMTVSKAATRVPASKLYLRPGQTITIEHLLYGILLASANDASMVLAEGLAGSVERYTEQMTKKAYDIGALNSQFTNPHGLTAPDHYSTARDLAILFKYAMKNPIFREIVQTKISSVTSNSRVKRRRVARRISVRNHNRLLWNFDGALGGKTGYTHAAQKCFVGAVARNGVTLIVSILGARDQWGDTKKLLQYGFENYQTLEPQSEDKTSGGEQVQVPSEQMAANTSMPQEATPSELTESYLLQVGSFRELDRAESLVKQFFVDGFEAFVETNLLPDGQTTYRVRVGPYAALPEAQEIAQEILQKSGLRVLILPAPAERQSADNAS